MFSISTGFARELQAILTLYLGTVLIGFSMGFSAVAIPDINNEMRNTFYWLNHFNNLKEYVHRSSLTYFNRVDKMPVSVQTQPRLSYQN